MAGPGGGPPRKSHTKSRKGCKTCKKRHIRCDETFPQCRNCTKHNCRCDYMDTPTASDEQLRGSRPAELLMTPEIEREIDFWRMTGEPPFPELRLSSREYWLRFSSVDLRLIHHIVGLSAEMHQRKYAACTVWAQKMPVLLEIAMTTDFVMSAILALSAAHLAWETNDPETDNLAYHHRGVALKGLHEAIGSFSRDNSEAILAASMLLSWQATEWRSWASLQQGVSTVINAMRPWMQESRLAPHLVTQRSIYRARTPVTPTGFNASNPSLHHRPEDIARLDRVTTALHDLHVRLANNQELSRHVVELLNFLGQLREDFPLQAPEEAFERLQQLRSWLFWLPPAMFRPQEGISDQGAFAVLAHFFAVALALDPLFPEIGGAYLGSMSVPPVEEMERILLSRTNTHPHDSGAQIALALMETPVQMCGEYKARQQYLASQQSQQQHEASWRGGSPRRDFAVPSMAPLASTPELPRADLFVGGQHHSPMQSPINLSLPGSPYFSAGTQHSRTMSQFGPNRSPGLRPQVMAEQRSHSFQSPLSNSTTTAYGGGGSNEDRLGAVWRPDAPTAFHPYGAGIGNQYGHTSSTTSLPEAKGKGKGTDY